MRLLEAESINKGNRIQKLINNYNYLRSIAVSLLENKIDIPLRERSIEDFDLDIEKVKMLPELRVK